MESVIIVVPRACEAEFGERLERSWKVSKTAMGGSVIEEGGGRVYVSRADSVVDDFDIEERGRVQAKIDDPVFYSVDFSDLAFCRRVLLTIADDSRLLLDNDHGTILDGDAFARLLREQPDWDWRRRVL